MKTSKSGSPIYSYNEEDKNDFQSPAEVSSLEEISDHIEKHVGKINMVFHELVSDQVHIDLHWVKPTDEKPFHTIVTSGMSDKPMKTPEEVEGYDFAELSICLPKEWKISEEDFENEDNYWPFRWLKYLARFPHEYNTWLGYGHTIPNGDPAEQFANSTKLNTMLLLPSIVFSEDFHELKTDKKIIRFYSLIPLYTEEVNLKMNKGVEQLFEGFDRIKVTDVLEKNRASSVKRKKFLGLF